MLSVIGVLDSFHHACLLRSKTGRTGECCPASANRRVQTRRSTAKIERSRSTFWIGLRMVWQGWKSVLFIVRPETVIPGTWSGLNDIGGGLSQRKQSGRPPTGLEIRKLIRTMASENCIVGSTSDTRRIEKL